MKVNFVKWTNVLDVVKDDKDMLRAFLKFYLKIKEVDWKIPSDVISTFNTTDLVKCEGLNRLVFNVGGNKYRLVCGYYFGTSFISLFVKFVGTHDEYDRIDICKINMFGK